MKNKTDIDILKEKLKTKGTLVTWKYFLLSSPFAFFMPLIQLRGPSGWSYKSEVIAFFISIIIGHIYFKIKQDDAVDKRFNNANDKPQINQSNFTIDRFRDRFLPIHTIILKDEQGEKYELAALKNDVKSFQIGDQVFVKYAAGFLFQIEHINSIKSSIGK